MFGLALDGGADGNLFATLTGPDFRDICRIPLGSNIKDAYPRFREMSRKANECGAFLVAVGLA